MLPLAVSSCQPSTPCYETALVVLPDGRLATAGRSVRLWAARRCLLTGRVTCHGVIHFQVCLIKQEVVPQVPTPAVCCYT